MAKVYYLDEFIDVMTHNLVGGQARKYLEFFDGEGVLCPRHGKASIVQILDDLESAFPFPLSAKRDFFVQGVISFIEVVGETILVASGMVARVTGVLFSTTCTTLFLRLERGSFFFALILACISWLNFVVISAKEKHFKKKKKSEENSRQQRNQKSTYYSFQSRWHKERRQKALDLSSDEPKFLGQPGGQNR